MMKIKDVKTATALIIQGYIRSNEESSAALFDCLSGIRQEVADWAENLAEIAIGGKDENALKPGDIQIALTIQGADVPRTPYNLISAAIALLSEAVDLNGPEQVLGDFHTRLSAAGRAAR